MLWSYTRLLIVVLISAFDLMTHSLAPTQCELLLKHRSALNHSSRPGESFQIEKCHNRETDNLVEALKIGNRSQDGHYVSERGIRWVTPWRLAYTCPLSRCVKRSRFPVWWRVWGSLRESTRVLSFVNPPTASLPEVGMEDGKRERFPFCLPSLPAPPPPPVDGPGESPPRSPGWVTALPRNARAGSGDI